MFEDKRNISATNRVINGKMLALEGKAQNIFIHIGQIGQKRYMSIAKKEGAKVERLSSRFMKKTQVKCIK